MMAKTMALGGWLLIAVGVAAASPQAPFSVANTVCLALYALLILSAGVFEWLMGIRNCYTSL